MPDRPVPPFAHLGASIREAEQPANPARDSLGCRVTRLLWLHYEHGRAISSAEQALIDRWHGRQDLPEIAGEREAFLRGLVRPFPVPYHERWRE